MGKCYLDLMERFEVFAFEFRALLTSDAVDVRLKKYIQKCRNSLVFFFI